MSVKLSTGAYKIDDIAVYLKKEFLNLTLSLFRVPTIKR